MSNLLVRNSFGNLFDDDFNFFPFNFTNNFMANSFKTDISEDDKQYIIEAELPGMKKENMQIKYEDNILSISAKRESKTEEKDAKGHIIKSERIFGDFNRSFRIDNINAENVIANYENGLLKITVPKSETKDNSTTIEIL